MDALLQAVWSTATLGELINSHAVPIRSTRSSASQDSVPHSRFTAQERAAQPKPVLAPTEAKGSKNCFGSSFAVRLCFYMAKHLHPTLPAFCKGTCKIDRHLYKRREGEQLSAATHQGGWWQTSI